MPITSLVQETSSQASFHTTTPVQEPIEEHPPTQDPDWEPSNNPEPSTNTMLANPTNPGSKGPAMAKPTSFDGNRKWTEQFLYEVNLMFLTRKGDYPDEFTKIAYVLSYMKGGSAGIWLRNFTKARNTADDWEEYTWKPTAGRTSMHKKISMDFEEFNK